MSTICVTGKIFFERLYLVLGLRKILLYFNFLTVLLHPHLRPFTAQLFLDFRAIFSPDGPSFFVHDSDLAESRYVGLGQILGESGEKIARKSRNSCKVNNWGCG